MHTREIQMPHAGHQRERYSDEFKRQVKAVCLGPGA